MMKLEQGIPLQLNNYQNGLSATQPAQNCRHQSSQTTPTTIQCSSCKSKSYSKDDLSAHIEPDHQPADIESCNECTQTACPIGNRDSHKDYTHERSKNSIKMFKCRTCCKSFSSEILLNEDLSSNLKSPWPTPAKQISLVKNMAEGLPQ